VASNWTFGGLGDLNYDGVTDLTWLTPAGSIVEWLGGTPAGAVTVTPNVPPTGSLGMGNLFDSTLVSYGGGASVVLAGVAPGTAVTTSDFAQAAFAGQSVGTTPGGTVAGTAGDDVLSGGQGNDTLIGAGGHDTYWFGPGSGQDVIRNGVGAAAACGELDVGTGVAANQLWLQRAGNDLQIAIMGTGDRMTVAGWYAGGDAALTQVVAGDGNRLDGQLQPLVDAMAAFAASHPGFDPTDPAHPQAPADPALQSALAAAWHH
jgi:hypothetical protein